MDSMASPAPVSRLSTEEYLRAEENGAVRHEYVRGQLFDRVGGTDAHNLICQNVAYGLREALRGGPCRVFVVDMKVRIASVRVFYYPDVFVTCDPDDREAYFKEKPSLVVEVLSDSTESIDRREKFLNYELVPSLREYVLVHQKRHEVEVFRRESPKAAWTKSVHTGDREEVRFESVGVTLAVSAIYEGLPV